MENIQNQQKKWTWKRILALIGGVLLLLMALDGFATPNKPCTGSADFCRGVALGYITVRVVSLVGGFVLLNTAIRGKRKNRKKVE